MAIIIVLIRNFNYLAHWNWLSGEYQRKRVEMQSFKLCGLNRSRLSSFSAWMVISHLRRLICCWKMWHICEINHLAFNSKTEIGHKAENKNQIKVRIKIEEWFQIMPVILKWRRIHLAGFHLIELSNFVKVEWELFPKLSKVRWHPLLKLLRKMDDHDVELLSSASLPNHIWPESSTSFAHVPC